MSTTVLFLYGSLKRGYQNHRLVADQLYIGEAVTEPRYRIIAIGHYGGLVEDADGLAVKGELWAVSRCCLLELDDFEGGEGGWARGPVAVVGMEKVEAYLYTGPIPLGAKSGDRWPLV